MDNASKIGQSSAVGSVQLFLGKTVATAVTAVGTIILGLFILPTEYGLYTIALIPASAVLLFQDWGVGAALTRGVAQCRAANSEAELRRIIKAGLIFEVATGLLLTFASLLMAPFLASIVFAKPESALLIALISVSILSTAVLATAQSIFIGFERMKLSSVTMICQAAAQGIVSVLLVYLGYGALGAALGLTIGSAIAGAVSACLLYFAIFNKLDPDSSSSPNLAQVLRPLLKYGVPLAVGSILAGVLGQFYSFMMASYVGTETIGNYKVAVNFTVLLAFFSVPISTVLFPVFSKIHPNKEKQLLKSVFASSAKYAALLLVPASMALMLLSKPIIETLYGNKWPFAPPFLALFAAGTLLIIFGNLSVTSLLTALGETKLLMKLNLLTLALGIPLCFLLIPPLGITGLIIVSIVDGIPSLLISVYISWKRYETIADLKSTTKILIASAIAATITYLTLNTLHTASWIQLVSGATLFLITYLVAAPLVGAINQTDINTLRTMFSGLGPLSKLLEIPLAIIEKPLRTRTKHDERTL
ncbi:MAG: oligosaccharide flippase family protein [Candidatus Bathyarchaeia archaeon]